MQRNKNCLRNLGMEDNYVHFNRNLVDEVNATSELLGKERKFQNLVPLSPGGQ